MSAETLDSRRLFEPEDRGINLIRNIRNYLTTDAE